MAKNQPPKDEATENYEVDEAPKAVKKPSETFKKYAAKYGKLGHCGDTIAEAFTAYTKVNGKADPVKLQDVADANGIDLAKWAHVNIGMQRMNLGNALRGMHNKGKTVVIGEHEIAGAEAKPEKDAA